MAVTKIVFINDIKIGYSTSAKIKPSLDIKETKTFDGPVIDGSPESSFDVDIDTLRYDTIEQYTKLTQLLFVSDKQLFVFATFNAILSFL